MILQSKLSPGTGPAGALQRTVPVPTAFP